MEIHVRAVQMQQHVEIRELQLAQEQLRQVVLTALVQLKEHVRIVRVL